jgi:hypothetical protein
MPNDVSNQAAGQLANLSQAKRDKTWDELDLAGKVERLRQVLRDQSHTVQAGFRIARDAQDLSEHHQHGHTGEVLRPARSRIGGMESAGRQRDPLA